jgi:hypothetical protein
MNSLESTQERTTPLERSRLSFDELKTSAAHLGKEIESDSNFLVSMCSLMTGFGSNNILCQGCLLAGG